MVSEKKARKEAAIKKAKVKKKIIIAACIGLGIVLLVFILISLLSSVRPDRTVNLAPVDVDMDLTALGENMMRAEVVNIMTNPDEYLDKTIKVSGSYYRVFEQVTGRIQNIVAVFEVDSCCPPEGLEIIVGDFIDPYSFDFPLEGTKIEVIGVFSTYEMQGFDFYYLAVDDVTILAS